jgi:hypothetical protein
MATKEQTIDLINTDVDGWQTECWDRAKSKKRFKVEGVLDPHSSFFDELKAAYGYKLEPSDAGVVFVPTAAGD